MKRIKKLAGILLAMVMVLGMTMTSFAQTKALDPADADGATITIKNPAKGETYSLHMLFDATVNDDNKNIAYQGEVPSALKAFFEADDAGYISPVGEIVEKDAEGKITGTKMTDGLKAALEAWAKDADVVVSEVSNGDSDLVFTGLPYGYYVVTTTHVSTDENGVVTKAAITVTSTQPDADIYDKNVNTPTVLKEVEKESYSIGDTVKYTGTFDTTNYIDLNGESKQVVDYVIQDTLPEYLADAKVTKITIGATETDPGTVFEGDALTGLQFGEVTVGTTTYEKAILIPWAEQAADGTYTNLYAQGAKIVVEYEAVLTSTTNINAADTNTISIRPVYVDEDSTEKKPWDETWEDTAEIRTYAAAIKKVDESGNPLAGATFTIKGLTVTAGEAGVYTVASYDPNSTTESAELSTDENGKLYIIGLASDVELTVTEFKAPDGYNKLTESKKLKPQILTKEIFVTSGERHYDEDGNLVSESSTATTSKTVEKNLSDLDVAALEIVNQKGTLLPSTGGIGTTIFYVVGGILVVAAGILLVTKKRMSAR
mgnify:CR=1 FL=1